MSILKTKKDLELITSIIDLLTHRVIEVGTKRIPSIKIRADAVMVMARYMSADMIKHECNNEQCHEIERFIADMLLTIINDVSEAFDKLGREEPGNETGRLIN